MEDLAISQLNSTTYWIDISAKVIISLEALILICLRRRLTEGDFMVNALVGSTILLYFYFFHYSLNWTTLAAIESFTPIKFDIGITALIAHILMGDLCFYAFHRLAHTRVFFLFDHSVHHSSRSLNFGTSMRISVFSIFYAWLPMTIPVVLGFHPGLLFACFALANAVPFFMHNQYIGKLGWIEHIFNTPSHHRVHHGLNPCYINKNFAGMFIFWDKLFGTYAEENEPVQYGVAGLESTQNPFKVLFRGWVILLRNPVNKALQMWGSMARRQ